MNVWSDSAIGEGQFKLIPYSDNIYSYGICNKKKMWISLDLSSSENGHNAADSEALNLLFLLKYYLPFTVDAELSRWNEIQPHLIST